MVKVGSTFPRVYHLVDLKGLPIKGCFYEHELKATQYPNYYLVEKVLKRKGNKVLVKWFGFDNNENSWIPIKEVKK